MALGALFLLLYGGVNAYTAMRHDIGTFAFAWEDRIPLIPSMLIPYCSLDAFFVLSFARCASRFELRRLSLRLASAIVIAAICFLICPLKLAFAPVDLSHATRAARWMLGVLGSTSQFNLAPSLHIALGLLLLQHYRPRVAHRAMRGLLDVWFAFILLSTVLTHQHHLIDLPTGAMLAAVVDWFWPREVRRDWPPIGVTRSWRIAAAYAVGALSYIAIAVITRGWLWTMLWPGAALAIVAAGYAGLGPRIFRKRVDGTLPWSTRIVLGPVLLGTWFARLPWRGRTGAPARVSANVYVGEAISRRAVERAVGRTQFAVLDLAAEIGRSVSIRAGSDYLSVPLLDGTVPPRGQVDRAITFIRLHVERGEMVYVHCALGYSRSVATCAAYVASCGIDAPRGMEAAETISRARGRTRLTRVARQAAIASL